MSSFAAYELSKADFGDKRLTKRIVKMVDDLSRNPEKTIPQNLSSWGDIKGCYRFMSNDKVTPEKVHNAHQQSTLSRIENYKIVLLIQDTTSIDFSSHELTEGLGYLERKHLSGILLHSTLALSTEGLPLGILTQQMWERPMEQYGKKHMRSKLPIEEKESYRWLSHRKDSNELIPNNTHRIHIADRECDIYDFLNMVRSEKEDYVIRMRHNRKLDIDGEKIKETMDRARQRYKLMVEVGRGNRRKPRSAELSVKYERLSILSPGKKNETTDVTVIHAKEIAPPKNEPAIEWYLLTSLEIKDYQGASNCLKYYAYRWMIERLHYVLKSGCKIEELQLRHASRLENAISVFMIIAWRILWTLHFSRIKPTLRYDYLISKEELTVLKIATKKKFKKELGDNPSVEEIVYLIGRLGGFIGRASDGLPGVKSLWRGMIKLQELLEFWQFAKNNFIAK